MSNNGGKLARIRQPPLLHPCFVPGNGCRGGGVDSREGKQLDKPPYTTLAIKSVPLLRY